MTPASVGLGEPRAAASASRGRWWLLMGVAALLLALDQGIKWVVAANLSLGEGITVTTWFNLVHVLNPGASFSFLADAGGWQRHALIAVGLAVSRPAPSPRTRRQIHPTAQPRRCSSRRFIVTTSLGAEWLLFKRTDRGRVFPVCESLQPGSSSSGR